MAVGLADPVSDLAALVALMDEVASEPEGESNWRSDDRIARRLHAHAK